VALVLTGICAFFGGGTSGSKNHEVNLRFKETRPENLHNTPKVTWTPGMGDAFWILVSFYLVSRWLIVGLGPGGLDSWDPLMTRD